MSEPQQEQRGQTVRGAVATRDKRADKLVNWLRRQQDDIAMAAASHIKPATVVRVAQGALRKNDKLMQAAIANPMSLLYAMLEAARLGHEPGTDEYWLVPFGNEVTGIEGYKGIIERMFRAGQVSAVVAEVVRQKDQYATRGATTPPFHEFDEFASDEDRGPMRGVYAYALDHNRQCSYVVRMGCAEVMAHKAKSKGAGKSDSPWIHWEPAMWKKGLALDTPVPTPAGWTVMDRIQPGDLVIDRDGQPTRVVGCSEVKKIGCYRVQFRSGASIICDEEHLWPARIGERAERTYSIGDLYAAMLAGQSVRVPVTRPVELPAADLPLDPWVLGYWLGDSNRHYAKVSCHQDTAGELAAAVASAGYCVGSMRKDPRSDVIDVGILGIKKLLAELGVLGAKHVPAVYLRGSAEQRLALLRGLMDSDGCAERSRRRVRFDSTLPGLRDAVAELARSLGEQVLTHERDASGFGKMTRFYEASWTPTAVIPFALTRKTSIARLRIRPSYGHQVKAIEPVVTVPTRCIGVDSPSRTYLAGRSMIPTHNTALRALEPYVSTSTEFRDGAHVPAPAEAVVTRMQQRALETGDGEVHDAEIVEDPAPATEQAPPQAQATQPFDREAGTRRMRALFGKAKMNSVADKELRLKLSGMLAVPPGDPALWLDSSSELDDEQLATLNRNLDLVVAECGKQKRDLRVALEHMASAADDGVGAPTGDPDEDGAGT